MKKLLTIALVVMASAMSTQAMADACDPASPFFDAVDCVNNGGTVGVPGSGGGAGTPGNPFGVPIDGGLSALLVAGGAMGARRFIAARKKK